MKRVAIGCVVMLAIFLAAAMISLGVSRSRSSVRAGSWLEMDLSGDFAEYRPPTLASALLLQDTPLLRDVTDALDQAAGDPKVTGVLARIDTLAGGWGKVSEIRDHLAAFGKSGKPSVCFLETAGEFGPGNLEYFLASACGRIVLAPSGDVNLIGLMSSSTFYRGTFDKLGIYPDMEHIGDYKSAMNTYTEKGYTPAHREMTESLLTSIDSTLTAAIAEGRKLPPEAVRALMDKGPFHADEAKAERLVDDLHYWDELQAELAPAGKGEPVTVPVTRYLASGRPNTSGRKSVAVVYAVGMVLRGKSDWDMVNGSSTLGSDSVGKWLHEAADDDSVGAIILRVDSPGGSPLASDLIWREVKRAKEKKPVIVSMSDLAGSGGYYIAVPATEIVAHPATLTASIGVLGGKLAIGGLYEKVGLSADHIPTHPSSDFYWYYQRFTPEQKEAHWKMLRRIYADFTGRVAEGRGMDVAEVDKVGQGRVWTGEQAKGLGLVDHLGGMDVALARARDLMKLDADAPVLLKYYPAEVSVWEALRSHDTDVLGPSTIRSIENLRAALRQASAFVEAASGGESGILSMGDVPVVR